MKATVGIGGRRDSKEALADSVGLDDKKRKVSDSKDVKENVTDTLDQPANKLIKKAVN